MSMQEALEKIGGSHKHDKKNIREKLMRGEESDTGMKAASNNTEILKRA